MMLGVQSLMSLVDKIPIPVVRDAINSTVHQAIGRGFNHLFISSAVVAVLTLLAVLVLGTIRKSKGKVREAEALKE